MLLSINYSKEAAQLYKKERIPIDRFKCPDWPDMIEKASELCPVYVHFSLTAGRGRLKNVDWDDISKLLEQTETPYVNLHLEAKIKDFPQIPVDTTNQIHQEQIVNQVLTDLQIAIQYFGAQNIILENVPYRGKLGTVLRPVIEPQIIQRVLDETGCGLLLDISHARISAMTIGMNERDYISKLPLDQLHELHFTGVHNLDGWLQDHLAALKADWQMLDWVMKAILEGKWSKPWMLAFEYGGVGKRFSNHSEPKVIKKQISLIHRRINQL